VKILSIKENFLNGNALVKNSAVLFIGTMLASVLNYFFHLIIGRLVSVEIYGETESLLSLINIISVPAMTLTMVATKYAASCNAEKDRKGSREIWKYLNKKVLKYGLPIFALAVVLTPQIGNFLNIKNNFSLILIWITMLLSFFSAINLGILRGWQKFKQVSLAGIWGAAAKLIFGVILVKVGFALNGIVGSFMLGALASYFGAIFALKFIITKKKDNEIEDCNYKIDFKSLKRYVVPALVGNFAIAILGNADMVLAKHNLNSVLAGQYAALTVVSKIIFFATGIIASVLFSMSAENHHKKSDTLEIFKNASLLVLGVSFCAVIFYFIFPEFVLGMLFRNKYADVAGYLGWFAIMVTIYSYVNLMFQYLLSIKKTKIAYGLFAVSSASSLVILFIGKDIYAILTIITITQISALMLGFYFLLKEKNSKKAEGDFVLNEN